MAGPAGALAAFYDDLSRFRRLLPWRDRRHETFTMHRRLRGPDGIASAQVVHDRLHAALRPAPGARLLDAGCGLGGTCLDWQARVGGQCDGLTLSPVQLARARAAAAQRGLGAGCRFHLLSYDGDLAAFGRFDAVVMIESLAHAPDPAATIARLAQVLAPGGRLAVIDDMPAAGLAPDDPDLAAFRAGWCCPNLASAAALPGLMAAAGLAVVHDEDLTPQMPLRDARALARLVRLNRVLRAAGLARVLLDGQYGGLMLERLYRRGVMQYRLVIAATSA